MNGTSENNQFEENDSSQRLLSKTFVWSDEIRYVDLTLFLLNPPW